MALNAIPGYLACEGANVGVSPHGRTRTYRYYGCRQVAEGPSGASGRFGAPVGVLQASSFCALSNRRQALRYRLAEEDLHGRP